MSGEGTGELVSRETVERLKAVEARCAEEIHDNGLELRNAHFSVTRASEDRTAAQRVLASLLRDEANATGHLPVSIYTEGERAALADAQAFIVRSVAIDAATVAAAGRMLADPTGIDRLSAEIGGAAGARLRDMGRLAVERVERHEGLIAEVGVLAARRNALRALDGHVGYLASVGPLPSDEILTRQLSEWEETIDAITTAATPDELTAAVASIRDRSAARDREIVGGTAPVGPGM